MLRPLHFLSLICLLGCYSVVQAGAPDFSVTLWKSPIPYIIDKQLNEVTHAVIRAAVQEIENNTCIDFQEGLDGPQMAFVLTGEFSSSVGDVRNGNNQQVKITQSTSGHGIQHEIYHALGFYHEQQRRDRDTYVTVDEKNIEADQLHANFDMVSDNENTTYYGIPYEYNSLIHYQSSAAALDNLKPTITAVNSDYAQTIDSAGHSMVYNDWKMINLHYKCGEKCPVKKICQNGGYQHPRDCNQCVCTRFHEGENCQIERNLHILNPGERVKLDFGWHFNLSTYRGIRTRFSENDTSPLPDYANLERSPAKIIKAPEGRRIKVTIKNIFDIEIQKSICIGCHDKALEIVDGDLTRVGKRFCCNKNLPYSFISETNVVGYHMYAISGLDFVANVTFTVEGSEPETSDEEKVTEQPITSPPNPIPQGTNFSYGVVVAEDYPRDSLYRMGSKKGLCHCGDKGMMCDKNATADPTLPGKDEVVCDCRQTSLTTHKCTLTMKPLVQKH